MLKMIFCLMLAVVANALPTDDATALPGGVEIATERGISPNEHQPLFASITPNEQCVSTTPWYNAGFNQVYQTHFGSQQEGSVVFPADERALLNTLVAAVEAQKRPTIVAGSHGYEGYGNSGDVVIDISGLQHIETKMAGPDNTKMAEHVVIGGGTPLSKVYNYLWKRHGRILPAGSCHSVSAGGHITGGGYGVFSRMYGLTVDYVGGVRFAWVDDEMKVRVVDAFHNSSSPEEQRLVWAARGASAANFGVILKYYVPLDSLQPSLSSPNPHPPPGELAFVNNPPAFWEVSFNLMHLEDFKDAEYGPMMLEKLYDVFWDYYNYSKGEQPSRDETFGFFRINSNGIDLTCIATKYDVLLEYVRGFLEAKNSTTADASLSTLEKDVRRFTFLEYVVVMSGIGDKPFFKNSGHVLQSHSGHGKGYTSSQLRVMYDHLLQKYTPCVDAACGEGYVTLEVFCSDKGSKNVTIQKVIDQTDKKSGKPQYFWISQHEARPASAQRRNGRRLAVWMGPQVDETALEGDADGPRPADSGVAYVWQMDPYNGKIADLTVDNPLKTPHAPSATSVSNRVATVKTQPQLYWNFPEDNKFMIKWFDSFTNSMWASTSTNKLNEEHYPMVPGLYINYPDSFYKEMYPEDWLNLTYGNGNNVQGDQEDYLPSLQEVKGMFDPNDIFTLKSRRYIYNATNGAWGDDKPEIKDGLSIPLPDSMPEPYHGGTIHEPDQGIEKLVVC